jgi:hypothetical protein
MYNFNEKCTSFVKLPYYYLYFLMKIILYYTSMVEFVQYIPKLEMENNHEAFNNKIIESRGCTRKNHL